MFRVKRGYNNAHLPRRPQSAQHWGRTPRLNKARKRPRPVHGRLREGAAQRIQAWGIDCRRPGSPREPPPCGGQRRRIHSAPAGGGLGSFRRGMGRGEAGRKVRGAPASVPNPVQRHLRGPGARGGSEARARGGRGGADHPGSTKRGGGGGLLRVWERGRGRAQTGTAAPIERRIGPAAAAVVRVQRTTEATARPPRRRRIRMVVAGARAAPGASRGSGGPVLRLEHRLRRTADGGIHNKSPWLRDRAAEASVSLRGGAAPPPPAPATLPAGGGGGVTHTPRRRFSGGGYRARHRGGAMARPYAPATSQPQGSYGTRGRFAVAATAIGRVGGAATGEGSCRGPVEGLEVLPAFGAGFLPSTVAEVQEPLRRGIGRGEAEEGGVGWGLGRESQPSCLKRRVICGPLRSRCNPVHSRCTLPLSRYPPLHCCGSDSAMTIPSESPTVPLHCVTAFQYTPSGGLGPVGEASSVGAPPGRCRRAAAMRLSWSTRPLGQPEPAGVDKCPTVCAPCPMGTHTPPDRARPAKTRSAMGTPSRQPATAFARAPAKPCAWREHLQTQCVNDMSPRHRQSFLKGRGVGVQGGGGRGGCGGDPHPQETLRFCDWHSPVPVQQPMPYTRRCAYRGGGGAGQRQTGN